MRRSIAASTAYGADQHGFGVPQSLCMQLKTLGQLEDVQSGCATLACTLTTLSLAPELFSGGGSDSVAAKVSTLYVLVCPVWTDECGQSNWLQPRSMFVQLFNPSMPFSKDAPTHVLDNVKQLLANFTDDLHTTGRPQHHGIYLWDLSPAQCHEPCYLTACRLFLSFRACGFALRPKANCLSLEIGRIAQDEHYCCMHLKQARRCTQCCVTSTTGVILSGTVRSFARACQSNIQGSIADLE